MWFGTASGLNRYDGYTFKVFKHDVNNKNSIKDDYITNIFEGPRKKLWISNPRRDIPFTTPKRSSLTMMYRRGLCFQTSRVSVRFQNTSQRQRRLLVFVS
jgi:ligand-binding sensor domain-containing protein